MPVRREEGREEGREGGNDLVVSMQEG